jgi:uracil-DNA glycosylase
LTWDDLQWWESLERKALYDKLHPPFLPAAENIYAALSATPLAEVKTVILGQDPYPTPGYAHGLAFSVKPEVTKLPMTLRNIFQELRKDLHCSWPQSGYLMPWAEQGVLLWNSVLTVAPYSSGSHAGWGWEHLTQEVLRACKRTNPRTVFVLWGNAAMETYAKAGLSVHDKTIIRSAHPSPLSAPRGFFGSRPFSRVNALLDNPIDWRL